MKASFGKLRKDRKNSVGLAGSQIRHRKSDALCAGLLSLLIVLGGAIQDLTPASAQEKSAEEKTAAIETKMASITLPSIEFDDTPLEAALDMLESKSMELDTIDTDPKKRGVKFLYSPHDSEALKTTKITLRLNDVPFVEALRYVTALGQWKYDVKPDGVHLSRLPSKGKPVEPKADATEKRKMDKSTTVTSDVSDKDGNKVPGLEFVARRQQNYVLEFVGRPDQERFQVTLHPSSKYRRNTFIVMKGKESSDGMFQVDDFKESSALRQGIEVDTSSLSITYLPDGSKHKLVRRQKVTIPTYFAEFKVAGDDGKTYIKKGDTFHLPAATEPNYKLIDVTEKKAVVEKVKE